jgi:hypothetical protein
VCTSWLSAALLSVLLLTAPGQSGPAVSAGSEKMNTLWQIGEADSDTREFALGPDGYRDFARDAFYVVGVSTPPA